MMVTKPPLNNPSKEKELHVVGLIKSSEEMPEHLASRFKEGWGGRGTSLAVL